MITYEYISGGWFRERGVPKGESADMLHGDHAVERYQQALCGAAFAWGQLLGHFEHHRHVWMTRSDVIADLAAMEPPR